MGLLVTFILLCVFFLGGVRTHEPVFIIGFLFLAFWAVLACFARFIRWLVGLTASPARQRVVANNNRSRPCPDARCGRVNVAAARFCAQCGRRLA